MLDSSASRTVEPLSDQPSELAGTETGNCDDSFAQREHERCRACIRLAQSTCHTQNCCECMAFTSGLTIRRAKGRNLNTLIGRYYTAHLLAVGNYKDSLGKSANTKRVNRYGSVVFSEMHVLANLRDGLISSILSVLNTSKCLG